MPRNNVPEIVILAGIQDEWEAFEKARKAFREACKDKLIKALAKLTYEHAPGIYLFDFEWPATYHTRYPDVTGACRKEGDRTVKVSLVSEIQQHYARKGELLPEHKARGIANKILEAARETACLLEAMGEFIVGFIMLPREDSCSDTEQPAEVETKQECGAQRD